MLIAMGIGLLAYRLGRPTRPLRPAPLIAADEDLITEEHLLMEADDSRLYGTQAARQPATDTMFERPGMNSRY